jgi:hypothetical protein
LVRVIGQSIVMVGSVVCATAGDYDGAYPWKFDGQRTKERS